MSVEGHLLVVWHPRPPSIARLRDAVLAGFDAAAAVLVTPENFGMVSGLVKDFLERIYPWFEEVPNRRPGLPYVLVSKGASDGTGAVRDVTRILTGLRWREVLPPTVIAGSVTDEQIAAVREQAATLAIGVDTGVF